ncbi:hypothetical protein GE061_012234 [Apolygus lucorum]|uniref:SMP-30/Gluconolactonase/LRE-like region domain-containing protein n=1 Tax=Apolygus lucorum TaxID=248454 RepID=A0A6A4K393_APOLU|nr:hypothetical protein GE061_012234 [Apolygus lucorum]
MYLIIRSNADDTSYKIERLDIEKKGFGEGPHWDVESQSLFFVDLKIGNICMYTPATERKISVKDWNGPVSFIVPVKGRKDHFVIGAELDVVLINWDTTKNKIVWKETLITVPDPPTNRLNDAKCDSTGRLWLGTMINEFTQKKIVPGVGFLYSYTGTMKGGAEMHLDNVTISNGIAISSDNKKFWYIDSGKFTVDQYDFNIDKGEISNLKTVFETKKHNISGFPDGMTIDNHGNLWVALYEGGVVIEVKPSTGELLRTLHFPKAHQTTSLAFGGPNLDELYVTTANEEVTPEDAVKYTESGLPANQVGT